MTSAASLKLLLRRRTVLSPGRSDFVPGLTTALEFVFIHESDGFPALAIAALPFTPAVAAALEFAIGMPLALFARRPFAARVGSRDGAAGACIRVRTPMDVVLLVAGGGLPRTCARRGILFGLGPFPLPFVGEGGGAGMLVPPIGLFTPFAAAAAVERVTLAGRCSDEGCILLVPFGRCASAACILARARVAIVGNELISSSSDSSVSSTTAATAADVRFVSGVLRG